MPNKGISPLPSDRRALEGARGGVFINSDEYKQEDFIKKIE